MKFEKDGNRDYVVGPMIHFAQLEAWTGCVVTTMNIAVKWSGQNQTFFSTS